MVQLRNLLAAALLISGVAAARAEEPSTERAMAAAAFAADDYRSAAELYARTRQAAEREGADAAWMADTLALARARLRLGDAAGARALLKEFSARFPAHDTGTLPGEILAAEGRLLEAEEFFVKLRDGSAEGSRLRGEAALALAHLQLRANEAASALEELTKLENYAELRREVRPLRVYAMIRAGRHEEALELIKKSSEGEFVPPLPQQPMALLELLAQVRSGRLTGFGQRWDELRRDLRPHRDELVFELLSAAAELAEKSEYPEQAASYWRDAYQFAPDDEVRRDVLRKLFTHYAALQDARQAAETAKRYAGSFPDASDRALLLTGAGRLLAKAGDHRAALELFQRVADDGELLAGERRDAARDAALTAEAVGDQGTARHFFNYYISSADSADLRQQAQIFYADYLCRRGDYAEAENQLRKVVGSPLRERADAAGRRLVQALMEQNKFDAALVEAKKLRSSDFGAYHTACLTEKLGRKAEALKCYRAFIGKYRQSEFVRPARYAAALLALEAGDCAGAARDFRAYADDYPGDPYAGSALFWAVRASCLGGDADTAQTAFKGLSPGAGPEYYAAALQLTEYLRLSKAPEEGLKIWDSLDLSRCGDAEAAPLHLVRARLLADCRRNDEALREAELVLDRYPASTVAADAAFLAGDLRFEAGDLTEAKAKLSKAYELRPAGVFGEAAAARVAECLMAQYQDSQRSEDAQKLLREADKEFAWLAREATDPDIRLLSMFKLGWCREYLGETAEAVDAFHQTLLYARELKRAGRPFDPQWCVRGVQEALLLLLHGDDAPPDAMQRAERIIAAAKLLGLSGGDEQLEKLKNEFNERYMNREM